jgi:hypothetical protein
VESWSGEEERGPSRQQQHTRTFGTPQQHHNKSKKANKANRRKKRKKRKRTKKMSLVWKKVFEKKQFTDIGFLCGDDPDPVFAHKAILCSGSEYFEKMFVESQMKESKSPLVTLPSTNKQALEEVFRFIYTAEAVLTPRNLAFVYSLADQFLLDGLKEKCLKYPLNDFLTILHEAKTLAPPIYNKIFAHLRTGKLTLDQVKLDSDTSKRCDDGHCQGSL